MQQSIIKTKEANIEKEETMNLLGFWNIEFNPSLIFIGDLSIILLTHFGFFFLLDSLEITASFGVILKIAEQDIIVAISAKTIKAMVAPIATRGLIEKDKIGIEYVLIMIVVKKAFNPHPIPTPSIPAASPTKAAKTTNREIISP